MRNGLKVWDTDTHNMPANESLEPYYDKSLRAKLPSIEQYRKPMPQGPWDTYLWKPERHTYVFPGRLSFQRILGEAGPSEKPIPNLGKYMGSKSPSVGVMDDDPDARIKDMDEEGADVHLIVPPGNILSSTLNDIDLEVGLFAAYHRYLNDFCGKYPDRLKALIAVTGSDIDASVSEIKRWGKERWCVGVFVIPGVDVEKPVDHPDFEPIWKAVDDEGLAVIHHSRAWTPPYFPGYRDLGNNLFLGRAASHPWGGMQAVGGFIGAGIMDRYPNLRFGLLECGCGWLPWWVRRLEDHVTYVGTTADLKLRFSEYITGGRFFCSIESNEGEDMVKMVADFLGDGVLTYASDYPHPECAFPGSVDAVSAWASFSDAQKRQMFWDNPVRLFGEP